MADELSRKRRTRGGHRSTATRIITGTIGILAGDVSQIPQHVVKLNQQRATLLEKRTIIRQFDAEILAIVPEEEIEAEIERADLVEENIQLAIANIDHALSNVNTNTVVSDFPAQPNVTASTSTEEVEVHNVSSPQSSPGASGQNESGSSPPNVSSHNENSSSPSRASLADSSAASRKTNVKLPKLELKKFDGDHSKWISFWDTFEASVHKNESLSAIDKFNYLISRLERSAAEAISGLTLTASNYEEAIEILKGRFGNKQQIINRHMEILLNLDTVTSHQNMRSLRKLHDTVESNVRSLKSLGVPRESYGGLLSSILMNKLPQEFRLVITREMGNDDWQLDQLLTIFKRELEARERAGVPPVNGNQSLPPKPPNRNKREPGTTFSLFSGSGNGPTCTYCRGKHPSKDCTTVINVQARIDLLKKYGRCFVCLRKDHISRNCPSKYKCHKCNGKHHISICQGHLNTVPPTYPAHSVPTPVPEQQGLTVQPGTNSVVCYSNSSTPVLLQTAQAIVYNPQQPECKVKARIVLDSGSQRTYLTDNLKNILQLPVLEKKQVSIKTFGSTEERLEFVEVAALGIELKGGPNLSLSAFAVPLICQPLQGQSVEQVVNDNASFAGLRLADHCSEGETLNVDILVGSDYYWNLVTGHTIRGTQGPTAIHTKLGWVLSGPVCCGDPGRQQSSNLVTTHVLKCATGEVPCEGLQGELKKFWDLESLGIKTPSIHEEFLEKLTHRGDHYQVNLPWKATHPPLPDNYELSQRRLSSLLSRLHKEPDILKEYDSVIRDQIDRGIVEVVNNESESNGTNIHYIPHHAVIRRDKSTTKLRIVYDASAKSGGPSLNECVHAGPPLAQNIFDIMLRFRSHRIALVGDIEKAFLMVHIAEEDRDVLRFLWVKDIDKAEPDVVVLRFTRVVFGLTASPFLLNATIKHHIGQYEQCDPSFTHKFLESIYVDDLTSGDSDVDRTFELYVKSKLRLKEAGFNLRKFVTNSEELRERIDKNEESALRSEETQPKEDVGGHQVVETVVADEHKVEEEDMTYSKSVLGAPVIEDPGEQKILGTLWNFHKDNLVFDLTETASLAKKVEPTKRNVISTVSKFYDPLGVISPIIIPFKILFQELCKEKRDWDDPLEGSCKSTWHKLVAQLQASKPIILPRCYYTGIEGEVIENELHGFCDASARAYGAVVYLRIVTTHGNYIRFIASKTRVAPLSNQTIPRLELLSAVVLARLMHSVKEALTSEIEINKLTCWTDSKVAWYWIVQSTKEWKQFVQHRVDEIRKLVPEECWNHCPGSDNPADILSRGMDSRDLATSTLWWNGPKWLIDSEGSEEPTKLDEELLPEEQEECLSEMKAKDRMAELAGDLSALTVNSQPILLNNVVDCRAFSCFKRLVRVTALVFKFIRLMKAKRKGVDEKPEITSADLEGAELCWIKEVQKSLKDKETFRTWKQQLNLFEDERGVVRCRGRLGNSDLADSARYPILLDAKHHFTALAVWSCHRKVMHGGVKETLAELRSTFWIVRGRYFVRKLLFGCTVCKKFQGKPYKTPPPPPLPSCRVKEAPAFTYIGLDYVGPLHVRSTSEKERKVWICLFTCCVTRAVHLEVVPNLTAQAFLRCFRRYVARRSTPSFVISDNAKTFKSASKELTKIMNVPSVIRHFTQEKIKWSYNLEKAPWWGGFYERLVKSLKGSLKKTIGRAKLTQDELVTVVTEAEMILNCRPISYVSTEDLEEPLTPGHLIIGRRISGLPEVDCPQDEDFGISQSDLSKRARHLNTILSHFWKRWRAEYLLELRNAHCRVKRTAGSSLVSVGDLVLVHDEGHPRSHWRLGKVERILTSKDGQSRGAEVRVRAKKSKRTSLLRRPLQLLYPLEVSCAADGTTQPEPVLEQREQSAREPVRGNRERRKAAVEGERVRREWIAELQDEH